MGMDVREARMNIYGVSLLYDMGNSQVRQYACLAEAHSKEEAIGSCVKEMESRIGKFPLLDSCAVSCSSFVGLDNLRKASFWSGWLWCGGLAFAGYIVSYFVFK